MKTVQKFLKDEAGLALTEYLLLFSLLSVLAVGSITYFGLNLGRQWAVWGELFKPGAQTAVVTTTSTTGGSTSGGTTASTSGGSTSGSGSTTGGGTTTGGGNGNGNGKNK